jgi:hypothetical protein
MNGRRRDNAENLETNCLYELNDGPAPNQRASERLYQPNDLALAPLPTRRVAPFTAPQGPSPKRRNTKTGASG